MLRLAYLLLVAWAATATARDCHSIPTTAHSLPILFLHGYASNSGIAAQLQQKLSTDSRPFVALSGCEDECSKGPLVTQLGLAMDQIRAITTNDTRFDDGYVLIGHSQGGALVRAIAAEMDDHNIHTLISVAGGANGLFYGPQQSDVLAAHGFRDVLAAMITNQTVFNYTQYTEADITSGKMVTDWVKLHIARPELQAVGSGYNLYRSPVKSKWIEYNPFWPVISNLQDASTDAAITKEQARRKNNFLRLKAAHFFGSPSDEAISPWQSAVLGAYEDVASIEALEQNFAHLKVLPMEETQEYLEDTYGLKTLDKRGALFLHVVPNISHGCWLVDEISDGGCKFQPVFEKTLYPLLGPL